MVCKSVTDNYLNYITIIITDLFDYKYFMNQICFTNLPLAVFFITIIAIRVGERNEDNISTLVLKLSTNKQTLHNSDTVYELMNRSPYRIPTTLSLVKYLTSK